MSDYGVLNRRKFIQSAGLLSGLGAGLDGASARGLSTRAISIINMTGMLKLDQSDSRQLHEMWDNAHVLAALQGLVNRRSAAIYQFYVGGQTGRVDRFWLSWMRQRGNWLGRADTRLVRNVRALIMDYRAKVRGLVVYDEHVASTSNVASTVAGVEDLLPIRFDPSPESLFYFLTRDIHGPRFTVRRWLIHPDGAPLFTGRGIIPGTGTASTRSVKCDAYIWAKELFLDTGRCNAAAMGYYIDAYWLRKPSGYIPNNTLSNHDYFIAQRGFFFDLSPWGDETPIDDPGQPLGTDQRTLREILRSAWKQLNGKRMIHIGGFIPWNKKYTNFKGAGGKHGGVATEWEYAYIVSCFNGYMDADALGLSAMANASVYQHYPLQQRYKQKFPTMRDMQRRELLQARGAVADKSFITIYVGDYDSAAWLYQMLPVMWTDPARGTIPLGWAFDPNLSNRFAPGMVYARDTKTPNDHFITGDSGAGYLNPGALQTPRKFSGLPAGIEAWRLHCEKYYRLWDIRLTGFIIDGDAPAMNEQVKAAYAQFSPDGVVAQKVPALSLFDQVPLVRMYADLPDSVQAAARMILQQTTEKSTQFRIYRTILRTPSWHKRLFSLLKNSRLGHRLEIVDPYSFMLLAKSAQENRQT